MKKNQLSCYLYLHKRYQTRLHRSRSLWFDLGLCRPTLLQLEYKPSALFRSLNGKNEQKSRQLNTKLHPTNPEATSSKGFPKVRAITFGSHDNNWPQAARTSFLPLLPRGGSSVLPKDHVGNARSGAPHTHCKERKALSCISHV